MSISHSSDVFIPVFCNLASHVVDSTRPDSDLLASKPGPNVILRSFPEGNGHALHCHCLIHCLSHPVGHVCCNLLYDVVSLEAQALNLFVPVRQSFAG